MSALSTPAPTSPEVYHFLLPVWNARYVQRFVEVGLPSMLAPDNLGAMPPDKTLFHVMTKAADIPALRKTTSFRRLESLLPVRIDTIDDFDMSCRYLAMSRCYEMGLDLSAEREAAFFFLTADSVWSDGAFRRCTELAHQGKRAVMLPGMMMWDLFSIDRIKRFHDADRDCISIPPRKLVKLLLEYPHPRMLRMFDEEKNPVFAYYLWRLSKNAIGARRFHLHPLMVWPRVKPKGAIYPTMDLGYVQDTCPRLEEVHVVTDSDEMCGVDLAGRDQYPLPFEDTVPVDDAARWVESSCNRYHREYAKHRICFHADGNRHADSPMWTQADARIDRIMACTNDRKDEGVAPVVEKLIRCMSPSSASWTPKALIRKAVRYLYRRFNYKLYERAEGLQQQIAQLQETFEELRVLVNKRPAAEQSREPTGNDVSAIYSALYASVLSYLQSTRVRGDVLEVGAGKGVRARLLAEWIYQTQWDCRMVLVDDYAKLGPPDADADETAKDVQQMLGVIIPDAHVRVINAMGNDAGPELSNAGPFAVVQFHGDDVAANMEWLQTLAKEDLLQDGCMIYVDDYHVPALAAKGNFRQAFSAFFQQESHFTLTEFIRAGWHGQALIVSATTPADRMRKASFVTTSPFSDERP